MATELTGTGKSTAFDFMVKLHELSGKFITEIFTHMSQHFQMTFFWVSNFLWISAIAAQFLKQPGNRDFFVAVKFFFAALFGFVVVFNPSIFLNIIYYPAIDFIYKMPAYIMSIATTGSPDISAGIQASMFKMFYGMDQTLITMRELGETITAQSGTFGGWGYKFKGWAISILYFVLFLVFVIMFCMGIMAAHVILVAMPIALPLAFYAQTRGIFFNVLRAFVNYGLIPTFAAVAMGITMFCLNDMVNTATKLIESKKVSEGFFNEAMLIGFFSFFLHLKAAEFASQVVGGSISNMGALAAGVGGIAGGAARAAGMAGFGVGGKMAGKAMGMAGRKGASVMHKVRNIKKS